MMSALHWICALTLTLTLLRGLSAQPVKRDVNIEIFDSISSLNDSIKNHGCIKGLTLYSPTNISPDTCLYSALNCTILELGTLESECIHLQHTDDESYGSFSALRHLLIENVNPAQTCSRPKCECQSCEAYQETNVTQFLENIKNLVQRLNSI